MGLDVGDFRNTGEGERKKPNFSKSTLKTKGTEKRSNKN